MKNILISSESALGRLQNSLYYSGLPALIMNEGKDLCFHADFSGETLEVFKFSARENAGVFAFKYHFVFSEGVLDLSCQSIEKSESLVNIFPLLITQDNPYLIA